MDYEAMWRILKGNIELYIQSLKNSKHQGTYKYFIKLMNQIETHVLENESEITNDTSTGLLSMYNCLNCGNHECYTRINNPEERHSSPPCTGWIIK